MAEELTTEYRDGVAVLTLNRPPANALAPSLRGALMQHITQAFENPEVTSVVLRGSGPAFCPGVDLGEYDGPLAAPWVSDLCDLIENAPKPVVVAIQGLALGAGLELALAAHGRIARAGTKIGMPEVTLGLVPGSGGTQRLPRIIGAQATLEMMLSGQTVDVGHRRVAPLFHRIVQDDPLEAAVAMARRLAGAGNWTRTRDLERGLSDPEGYRKAVAAVEEKLHDKGSAEAHILACIEAAQLLPFDQGLEFETTRFMDSIHAPLARGIRHSFVAARRASTMPETAQGRARPVRCVGLVGTAPIIGELALLCLGKGLETVLVGQNRDAVDAVVKGVRAVMEKAVQDGHVSAGHRDGSLQKLSAGTDIQALSRADLVLDMGAIAFDGPPELKETAVWAVLNQARDLAERAAETGTAGRTVGLRVYRPAESRKLMELVVPKDTGADAVATLVSCFAGQDRSVVRTVDAPGMLGENMMAALTRAGMALVAAGADPFEVDRAAMTLGFPTGVFRRLQDIGPKRAVANLRKLCADRGEDGGAALRLAEALIDWQAGIRRIYKGESSAMQPDDGVHARLQDWRARHGGGAALPQDVTLTTALLAALVNEGGRLLGAQAVLRASDIDVAMVQGFGFDRKKGGPLLQADLAGLLGLVRAMKKLTPLDAEVWTPTDHVDEMIKYGQRFF